jgi:acyl-coenzyme A synthetase/AMP-(fatty) acid ligase
VEDALMEHPHVVEAAFFGFPPRGISRDYPIEIIIV